MGNSGLRTHPSPAWMRPTMLGSDRALRVRTPCCYPTEPCANLAVTPPSRLCCFSLSPEKRVGVLCGGAVLCKVCSFLSSSGVEVFPRSVLKQTSYTCFSRTITVVSSSPRGSCPVDFPICSDFIQLVCFSPSHQIIDRSCFNFYFRTCLFLHR